MPSPAKEGACPPPHPEEVPPLDIPIGGENSAEKLQASKEGNNNHQNNGAPPNPSCLTCGSSKDCEVDKDSPRHFYCKNCREEYETLKTQQSQQGAPADAEEDGSPSASEFLTPRGTVLHTQGDEAASVAATPSSQALQTQVTGLASTQEPASQEQGAKLDATCTEGDDVSPKAPSSRLPPDGNDLTAGEVDIAEPIDGWAVEEDGTAKSLPDTEKHSNVTDQTHDQTQKVRGELAVTWDENIPDETAAPEEGEGGDRNGEMEVDEKEINDGDDGQASCEGGSDDEEGKGSVCTQEDMSCTGMDGAGFGLLTQAAEDSETEDDDSVSVKEADDKEGGDEKKGGEDDDGAAAKEASAQKPHTETAPLVVEAVATSGHDKDMTLSGLTEPSQAGVPHDKLPTFSTIGHETPSQAEDKSMVADAALEKPPNMNDEVSAFLESQAVVDGQNGGTISNRSIDASSAYRGLTEEEEADDAAENSKPKTAGDTAVAETMAPADREGGDASPRLAENAENAEGERDDPLGSKTGAEEKENEDGSKESDHDDPMEGTGDTIVTTGSGTAGWSLYDGETQALPSGPSQIAEPLANVDGDDDEMNVHGDDPALGDGEKLPAEEDAAKKADDEAAQTNLAAVGDAAGDAEDPFNKETQQLDKSGLEEEQAGELEEDITKVVVEEREQSNEHSALLESMKHTPDGVLPISYPNEHLDNNTSPTKEASPEKPPQEAPQPEAMDEDDDETQLSLDLLATSPAKSSRQELVEKASQEAAAPEDRPEGPETNDLGDSTQLEEHVEADKTVPTSPSHQTNAADSTRWMSSTRHLHENEEAAESPSSSPRLLLPSFKPSHKKSHEEPEPADEEESDHETWPGHGHNHSGDNDPLENTQDEHEVSRPSALKRFSRGTSSRPSARDDSASRFSLGSSGGGKNKESGTKSAIRPKVLRYGAVARRNDEEEQDEDDASSSAPSDSSSEAELDDLAEKGFPMSQTDQRIMKQLKEVRGLTAKMPSAEEMEDIASRKQLLSEIKKLRKSHKSAISKLKRENGRLVAQLSKAEDVIDQKDIVIREKNALLEQQFEVISQFTSKIGGVAAKDKRPAKKHTPATKKGRKRAEKPSHSDSDSDDDEVPLSTLKSAGTSSSNKKRRKSYGSRQTKTPSVKKAERVSSPKRASSPKPAKDRSSDTSSVETALTSNTSPVTNKDAWKVLKEKGWRYRAGPQPYNQVYVPPDGSTHVGTQLGIHFFDDINQAVEAAIKRGDLPQTSGKAPPPKKSAPPKAKEPKANKKRSPEKPHYPGYTELTNDNPLDDTTLCGKSKILTLESAKACIDLVALFAVNDDRFVGSFFQPLWNRLKSQGADADTNSDISWRYEAFRGDLSRNWCFVPPSSTLGAKGVLGKDYHLTEEQVVLCVLKEVLTMKGKDISCFLDDQRESFATFIPVLTRAVDESMEYNDAKEGKSATVRTRRTKNAFQPESPEPKSAAKGKPKSGQKKSGKSPLKKSGKSPASKKRPSKITPDDEQPEEYTTPSFHASQTQGEAMLPSYSRRTPGQSGGPLSGYQFFYSSIDDREAVESTIKRLGGKIVQYDTLTSESSKRRVFFLGDYTGWRKTKHIHAASLGVPMLHHKWLADLETKYQEEGTAKVFDSELFVKYRLPIGLDLSRGFYPLQRASNARSWDGGNVFSGMTVALAIDPKQENDWSRILTASGATVKTISDMQRGKGKTSADCCLFASTALPPHVVSNPVYVSTALKLVADDVPLLDLAWAHQAIIQRKRLPFDNPRYAVSLDQGVGSTHSVYSIKSKSRGNVVRYEVGDLVQFSRGPKSMSRGRIIGINWERQGKVKLEVKLLDLIGDYELVDCPSSAEITVDENSLQGNLLLLGARDFRKLGYLPSENSSNIFNRVVPSDASQQ